LPHNASRQGTVRACENSLQRLGVDMIDLYLLHWPGPHPLSDTVEAFHELKRTGKIQAWGVSNFDTSDMEDLWDVPGGADCQTNQVLYNLMRRGVEWDLFPWCAKNNVSVMAYSPLEQGRLLNNRKLNFIAKKLNLSAAQVAISWTLRKKGIISIPKASSIKHVEENIGAWSVDLDKIDCDALDEEFKPPVKKGMLDIL